MRHIILSLSCLAFLVASQSAQAKHQNQKGDQDHAECTDKLCKKKDHKHEECSGEKGGCKMPAPITTASFELLKSLQGTWKGTMEMAGKPTPITLLYRVISGGTAIMETIFPGQPMEMISVYVVRDGKVHMTHYCSLGNQPQLVEKSASASEVEFAYLKSPGINTKKDMYMASMVVTLVDAQHMKTKWLAMKGGKEMHSGTTEFTRVK